MDGMPTVVIGAGIIGLSVAYELSIQGKPCIILEARENFAEGASSRNSEVIHGGFLSRKNSIKQKMCVIGGDELRSRLREWDITWNKCGKLVVSVQDEETKRLEEIVDEASRIGVTSIFLHPDQVRELEPAMSGEFVAAAWFPDSSVFDTHSYMERLIQKMEDLGSNLLVGTKVIRITFEDDYPVLHTQNERITCKAVINSTGVDAHDLVSNFSYKKYPENLKTSELHSNEIKQEAWIGRWYRLNQKSVEGMKRLVYRTSTPDQPGLGVHTTPDWAGGGVRLGPDSSFLPELSQSFIQRHKFEDTPDLRKHFLSRLGPLYPHITIEDLVPDQSGIRSRAYNYDGDSDFIFMEDRISSRVMHLLGMESPGITASPAVAKKVSKWFNGL